MSHSTSTTDNSTTANATPNFNLSDIISEESPPVYTPYPKYGEKSIAFGPVNPFIPDSSYTPLSPPTPQPSRFATTFNAGPSLYPSTTQPRQDISPPRTLEPLINVGPPRQPVPIQLQHSQSSTTRINLPPPPQLPPQNLYYRNQQPPLFMDNSGPPSQLSQYSLQNFYYTPQPMHSQISSPINPYAQSLLEMINMNNNHISNSILQSSNTSTSTRPLYCSKCNNNNNNTTTGHPNDHQYNQLCSRLGDLSIGGWICSNCQGTGTEKRLSLESRLCPQCKGIGRKFR
ncbi:5944_t:CDS:2 [Entrophospora sp. SA101]|nr:6419_t:CDS:2 [Entrophospora sp. SA101]CAJ0638473.1 14340_t:CDS:2 [Entrophospora sp. SA101]CAJ0745162.1 5944_t:CDS:2 [Entrophospora sp. SA101]CAJ0826508.1 5757_t:CDS:2 [Entrophospora sp. SA101]CAJ0831619.1 7096_t:CDS:2 [Entrophospora sp. SA101]